MGEGIFSVPFAICQSTGPIPDLKTAFDSSGLELLEHVAKVYLNETDDITGRVKSQIFLAVIAGLTWQSSRIKLK